ncbi:dihydrofolate reductase [Uliginosibacterium sediminicola]|uniref:Dihydrofolate reductase n=1 Tax=Uliginosibacterium sediminicola TaxID=2024550 RepID=A0ABU9YY66_9RHOO
MSGAQIKLIVAAADNGVIGRDNALLWRLREDMRYFRATTLNHPVIMGRKTWESVGRPLPQRRNIVITRQPDFVAEGAETVASLDAALALCADEAALFVIGGEQIYALALPLASEIHLTRVHCTPEGDAFFPPLDAQAWEERIVQQQAADAFNEHAFETCVLTRKAL